MPSHPKFSARQQASVRDQIQASRLVKFLQEHAVNGRGKNMSVSRVRAALGLLAFVLPRQVEATINERPCEVSEVPMSPDEWDQSVSERLQ